MLNADERRAIQGLFDRLAEAERNSAPRELDAEELIAEGMRRVPAAPYYMAQTIIMQNYALEEAERQINEMRAELDRRQSRSGGLLGGLFGDSDRNSSRRPYQPQPPAYNQGAQGGYNQGGNGARGPWGGQQGGGGFLAGAAQTALGVTGGVLLGSALAGMVGGAFAGEPDAADQPAEAPEDTGGDLADNGGDFGDGGDFGGGEF